MTQNSAVELCPYCKKRTRIKATCGYPDCQIKHQNSYYRRWWRKNKDIYKGAHRKKGQSLVDKATICV